MMKRVALLSGAVSVLMGCLGVGEGWVSGPLWVENCDDGEPFGESFEAPGDFDLNADFFAGEPIEDTNGSTDLRKNSLTLRIQNASNNTEVSNGLLLQMKDLDLAARSFAARLPIPISASLLCSGGNCEVREDGLRASVYMFSRCPDGRQPLNVTNQVLKRVSVDSPCVVPTGESVQECPQLTDSTRAVLEGLCDSDFNDRDAYEVVERVMGDGACLFLCRFGAARIGQSPGELRGFRVGYGDRVAGILSMRVVDGRALNLQTCAGAAGILRGMFNFEVVRGRAAQTFP